MSSARCRPDIAALCQRFWPALHRAGFTDRLLTPAEERTLLHHGCGITNLVARSAASAAELSPAELADGCLQLTAKVKRFGPRYLAVLGVHAFRTAFDRPKAALGRQAESLGDTTIWVLPNPSGLNAHYQLADLVRLFRDLLTHVRVTE